MEAVTNHPTGYLMEERLALDTLYHLQKFLVDYNRQPCLDSTISTLATEPRSLAKCKAALSFLPNDAAYNGGNFKIILDRTGSFDFKIVDFPSLEDSSLSYKLLLVSEAAKRALHAYSEKLAKEEESFADHLANIPESKKQSFPSLSLGCCHLF